MTQYCPICGEKDTIRLVKGTVLVCTNCKNIVKEIALLDNVENAYKVWLNYNHLKANGFIKEKGKKE